jgi:hypothetical protein
MAPTRRAARATGATGAETRTLSERCARAEMQSVALARSAIVSSSRMNDIYEGRHDAVSISMSVRIARRFADEPIARLDARAHRIV